MKNLLSSLNGWQRSFVFLVIFFYIPTTALFTSEIESTYALKYSDEDLNSKVYDYLQKEKIDVTVEILNRWDKVIYKFAPLADYVPEKNYIKVVDYSSASSNIKYLVRFDYKKDLINFDQDIEIIKLSKFIQATIDKNEIVDTTYKRYIGNLFGFFLVTLGTYFLGFMIGWVAKGFRRK
jgi:hypothetical protein